MNKKLLGSLLAIIVVAIVSPAIYFSLPKQVPTEPQQNIDVVITGENTCLRFLEKNVSTCYIPFRTEANEQWRLAIECLEMPNQNAWTDLYLYRGYWDGGTDYKCLSEDIYPIIDEIETTGQKFKAIARSRRLSVRELRKPILYSSSFQLVDQAHSTLS
jgi:hypothetical protein